MYQNITPRVFPQSIAPYMRGPADFPAHIRSVLGFSPSQVVPGKITRFATSDKRGDLSGWAFLFDDGMGGIFGCWRSGGTQTWQARQPRTEMERRTFAENTRKAREKMERIKAEQFAVCRAASARLWGIGRAINSWHPYIIAKGIIPYGGKQLGDSLLIPVRGHDGTLRGLQFIGPDGRKKFKSGTEVSAGHCRIGTPKEKTVLVCEGWATGCTLHEATGHAVAVAFFAGNVRPVCEALRNKYFDWRLIICGDDDHYTSGNPGLTRAKEAAHAVDGMLAIPDFSGIDRSERQTDFNDLAQCKGTTEIVRIVREACHV